MSEKVRRLATVEDVLSALAAQCDGAKSRDGRGFNRPDAHEGGRLAALVKAGFGWSVPDTAKAKDIVGRYAKQAGTMLGGGREAKSTGIERSIREGYIKPGAPPVQKQRPYDFASVSSGGKQIHLWRMSDNTVRDVLHGDLREISLLRHGERRIGLARTKNAETTINGRKTKFDRYELDLNETTRIPFLDLCGRHGILAEPSLFVPCGADIDEVRRSSRSAWIHRGTRDGEKGQWAVFDLAKKDEGFSDAVKTSLKGCYKCEPSDDWNWYVSVNKENAAIVLGIADEFGFARTPDFTATVVPSPFLVLDF